MTVLEVTLSASDTVLSMHHDLQVRCAVTYVG